MAVEWLTFLSTHVLPPSLSMCLTQNKGSANRLSVEIEGGLAKCQSPVWANDSFGSH